MIKTVLKTLKFLTLLIILCSFNSYSQFKSGIVSTLEAVYPDINKINLKKIYSYNLAKNSDFEALILINSDINKEFTFNSDSENLKNVDFSIIGSCN